MSLFTTGFTTDYTIYDDVYDFYYNGNFTTTLTSNNLQADSPVYQILINASTPPNSNTFTNCSVISSSGLPTGYTSNQLLTNIINDTTTNLISNNQICNSITATDLTFTNTTTTNLISSNMTLRPLITTLTFYIIDSSSIQSYSTFIFNSASTTVQLEALGADYDGCLIHIRFQAATRTITRGTSLTNMCSSGSTSNSASLSGLGNLNFVFLYLHSYGGGASGLTTGSSMLMINNV